MPGLYFDHNATTPLCAAAREAWLETADRFWHNPSSLYPPAGAAKRRLEDARETLADMLGVDDPERIVFTGGATEANNAAVAAAAGRGGDALASAFEHPSLLSPLATHFAARGRQAPTGPDELAEAIGAHTSLVAVMAANNETGEIFPAAELAAAAREAGVPFLCDATQAFGKLDSSQAETWGDIVVASAHKFGGPKGVGFVLLSDGAPVRFPSGGPQESRHRAGTEDLAGICAMVAALAAVDLEASASQSPLRDEFERSITARVPGTRIIAQDAERLPNTSMLVLPRGRNLKWLTRLGRRGVCISTGSACSSGAESGSHVLRARGLSEPEVARAVRISSGPDTKAEEWRELAAAFSGVWEEFDSGGAAPKPSIDLGAL